MYQDFPALNPDKDRDLVSLFDVARFCYAKDKISWKQGQKKKKTGAKSFVFFYYSISFLFFVVLFMLLGFEVLSLKACIPSDYIYSMWI
jgi:hypothetical protein